MPKLNVLLLTIDTLRADRLGCYGCPRPLTPNLDRLAARGIRFDQAITGGSWTQAAFPVILTSTHASMYGGCLGPLSPERPSPVKSLAQDGYTAGAFVTSPMLGRSYGYHRGFNHFVELVPDERDPFLRRVKGGEHLLRRQLTHQLARLFGSSMRPARSYVQADEVNKALYGWLETVDQPFFGWIHYMDVHWPYHREASLTRPAEIAQAWRDVAHLHAVNWQGAAISDDQRQHYIDLYEGAVQHLDWQLGELLDFLNANGFLDNTIIVVTSDHGEEFLERRHWGHVETNLYDEIVKIPLIMALPNGNKGRIIQQQVRLLDLMPTILDLCECPLPDNVEGMSMLPLWEGDPDQYDGAIAISERWRDQGDISHIISVRTETFKYIWNANKPENPKLYNLQLDPGETMNLHEEHLAKGRELHQHVEESLRKMIQTAPQQATAHPDWDEEILGRLRGLGYVE